MYNFVMKIKVIFLITISQVSSLRKLIKKLKKKPSSAGIPNMDKIVIEEDVILKNFSILMLINLQVQIRFIQEFYTN